jgi:putative heme-binding domain-containing protein
MHVVTTNAAARFNFDFHQRVRRAMTTSCNRLWLVVLLMWGMAPAAPAATAPAAGAAAAKRILASLKAPAGFDLTLFAAPPQVNYPTCLTATPRGELFIGIDEQGSLGREANKGRIVRCVDSDNDGAADQIVTFAQVDHPRGLVWDDAAAALYVLHPPTLTRYFDDNRDGVADRSETIVSGIGNDQVQAGRGADHTTNGIRLGIDGWIYIAVGDFGCPDAQGADGTHLRLHGGGIVRVRTDGSGLETYVTGTRNLYDVAIDPLMNVFTRDNTNDGDGWNDRLAYDVPGGYYGYPSRFKHFPGEFVDCLIDFGGGSPCGSLFVDEQALPAPLGHALYTVEWGNNCIDRHPLTVSGAGFKASTEKLMDLPRGTDIDIDGAGRLYISSWANGGFSYSGPDIGYVIRLAPSNGAATKHTTAPATHASAPSFPDLHAASDLELLEDLASGSGVCRQAAQREILHRGEKPAFEDGLMALAKSDAPLAARVAAVFTLKLMRRDAANPALVGLCRIEPLREFALRALADRKGDAKIPAAPFLDALRDPNPRVRLIAAWGTGRLERPELAGAILPLAVDPDSLVRHVALNSLVSLNAVDACLGAVSDTHANLAGGALDALRQMHDAAVVQGLVDRLAQVKDAALRARMYRALCRLYWREGDWDGGWWGTRPDTSGPYFKPVKWAGTASAESAILQGLSDESPSAVRALLLDCAANKVDLSQVSARLVEFFAADPALCDAMLDMLARRPKWSARETAAVQSVARDLSNDPARRARAIRLLSGDAADDASIEAAIDALGEVAGADKPAGALAAALDAFIQSPQHARRVALLARLSQDGSPRRREVAFAALARVADGKLTEPAARQAAQAAIEHAWQDASAIVPLLRAIGRAKAMAFADAVRLRMGDRDPTIATAAVAAGARLGITSAAPSTRPLETIASLGYDKALASTLAITGDAKLGQELFTRQGCIACHTVSAEQAPRGPFLGGISARYSRRELLESILKPSAKIAQGFETQWFKTKGDVVEGFVTREAGDEIELRNVTGKSIVLKADQVKSRGKREISVMPEGLAAKLSPSELASIIRYLESLKAK